MNNGDDGRRPRRPAVLGLATLGMVLAAGLVGRPDEPSGPAPIAGRVLDEAGRPVAGADVRVYRRVSQWAPHDLQVEEARTGPDGGFRLATAPLAAGPLDRRDAPFLALVVAHPDYAIGWRTLPRGPSADVEVRLARDGVERTIAVRAAGRPLAGATVAVVALGDPDSPLARLREPLPLHPLDGPLTATTDAAGRAHFANLPPGTTCFEATGPGYAANSCFRAAEIRLTPAATLEGTVTGPRGQPLAGVAVVLMAGFVYDFEVARTDAQGRYRFDALAARGWDRSGVAEEGSVGDGSYKLWIDDRDHAIPTLALALEPGERRVLDLRAEAAGVIRVAVVEEGTGRPVAGVGVSGTDAETGNFARFHAETDAAGVARIACAPAPITLALDGAPAGMFVDRRALAAADSGRRVDFGGGELDLTLILPRIGGRVVAVAGVCLGPDGAPAAGAAVYAAAEPLDAAVDLGFVRSRRGDRAGEFVLDGVPAGRSLGVCAISPDGRLGAWRLVDVAGAGPPAPIRLALRPTVAAEFALEDDRGGPLPLHPVAVGIAPRFGAGGPLGRRILRSDATGRVRVDGAIPGLTYRIGDGPAGGRPGRGGVAKAAAATLDADLILAPE